MIRRTLDGALGVAACPHFDALVCTYCAASPATIVCMSCRAIRRVAR
jgi:hypothetical protein